MKKFIGLVVLLTISLSTFAQKGDFSLLGNFGYQTDFKRVMIGAQGRYILTNHVRLAPDLMFFFPKNKVTGFDIDVNAALSPKGVKPIIRPCYVDDETVIRMVGKGLGISMMSELMIRGNTEDVYCVPVSPTCIREIGMGMKPGTEENGSIAKLRECVMQFVSTLNKGGNVSLK